MLFLVGLSGGAKALCINASLGELGLGVDVYLFARELPFFFRADGKCACLGWRLNGGKTPQWQVGFRAQGCSFGLKPGIVGYAIVYCSSAALLAAGMACFVVVDLSCYSATRQPPAPRRDEQDQYQYTSFVSDLRGAGIDPHKDPGQLTPQHLCMWLTREIKSVMAIYTRPG